MLRTATLYDVRPVITLVRMVIVRVRFLTIASVL
jgi:hypothetical protein